jgi:threonyl-tRNA synthetase
MCFACPSTSTRKWPASATLLRRVYARFGFREFIVGLSTRPAVKEGSDALWDHVEATLASAATSAGLEYRLQPGEGAFYGPKLEFILKDREGREWQCGTIQLDSGASEESRRRGRWMHPAHAYVP